jgi:hypothetical protein
VLPPATVHRVLDAPAVVIARLAPSAITFAAQLARVDANGVVGLVADFTVRLVDAFT